jgi:hypothetical protein
LEGVAGDLSLLLLPHALKLVHLFTDAHVVATPGGEMFAVVAERMVAFHTKHGPGALQDLVWWKRSAMNRKETYDNYSSILLAKLSHK